MQAFLHCARRNHRRRVFFVSVNTENNMARLQNASILAGMLLLSLLYQAVDGEAMLNKGRVYDSIYVAMADAGNYAQKRSDQQVVLLADLEDLSAVDDEPNQEKRVSRQAFFSQAHQQLPRRGRQDGNSDPVIVVEGFPAGLPQGTPTGVQIALASMANLPPGVMPPIPGVEGIDYPVYTTVPVTGFDCNGQTFLPGIYADTGAQCQSFYMCQADGNFNAFLCPNGTIFNQQYFICDWWYNVDCGAASSFYGLNEFLYQDQPQQDSFQFNGGTNNIDNVGRDNFVSNSFGSGNSNQIRGGSRFGSNGRDGSRVNNNSVSSKAGNVNRVTTGVSNGNGLASYSRGGGVSSNYGAPRG